MSLLDILSTLLHGGQQAPAMQQGVQPNIGALMAMLGGDQAGEAPAQPDQPQAQAAPPSGPVPDPGANPTPQVPQHSVPDLLTAFMQQSSQGGHHVGLGNLLGILGSTISQATGDNPNAVAIQRQQMAGQQQQQQSAAQRTALFQMAKQLNLPPQVQLMFAADPEGTIAKMRDQRYGFHDLAGGHTGVFGDPNDGGTTYSAPDYGVKDGEGYSARPDSLTDLGSLAQSYQQQQEARDKEDAEAEKAKRDDAQERYWDQLGGAATERARKYNTGRPGGGGGGFALPPGFKVVQ